MAKLWVFALLTVLLATPVFGLTVEDVIDMTEAGLGDEVIIQQIRATHATFDLTVDEIIALSEAGVSDPVLSAMIASAFDESEYDTYGEEGSTSTERYTVIEEEPEPDVHTYLHVGWGYYGYPWTDLWWDYGCPSWDYYWYAGWNCEPYWCAWYQPWWHRTHSWYAYDWCDPWGHGWCDRDRLCDARSHSDRVRWKSDTAHSGVTLAGARTRMKAIQDSDRGRNFSPLAQLEPKRTKTSIYRGDAASKKGSTGWRTAKQYASAGGKDKAAGAEVVSLRSRTKHSRTLGSAAGTSRSSSPGRATVSRTKHTRGSDASPSTGIRATDKRTRGSQTSGVGIRSKSPRSSSDASHPPSVRSSGSSKSHGSATPSRSSGSSGSKSKPSGSGGSKGRK
jgi:hypothetical protein